MDLPFVNICVYAEVPALLLHLTAPCTPVSHYFLEGATEFYCLQGCLQGAEWAVGWYAMVV